MNVFYSNSSPPGDEVKESLQWLIKLRWVGCIEGILVTIHVLTEISDFIFSVIPIYLILGFVACYNTYFKHQLALSSINLSRNALFQILCDYLALTGAIYFSGGWHSPFLYFFIFHVIISGVILPRRWTFWITGFGIVIPITLATLTYFHLLPSFSILKKEPLIISDISVAIPYGVVFASTLALTAYFVTYLVDRLREKHEEIRRLYLFSEKLRSSIIMDKVMETIREEIAVLCGNSRVVYLSLDKDRLQLGSKTQQDSAESLDIPVNDRNAFWATLISGEVHIIESAALKSSYEEAVFAGLMPGAQKIVILPAQASFTSRCRDFFNCPDTGCQAYTSEDTRCWYISGTHCRGRILRTEIEKLRECVNCEIFMPVGIFLVDITRNSPLDPKHDIDACMRLLKTAGQAISNARLHEKTEDLCDIDRATGVKNQKAVLELFRAEILRAARYGRHFGVAVITIEDYGNYLSQNGVQQASMLMKLAADLMTELINETDIIGRHGEDAFLIILPETSKAETVFVMRNLQQTLEASSFPRAEVQPRGRILLKVGTSAYPEDGHTTGQLIAAATIAPAPQAEIRDAFA